MGRCEDVFRAAVTASLDTHRFIDVPGFPGFPRDRVCETTGRPLGGEGFVRHLERPVGRVLRPARPGRKPKPEEK